MGLKWSELDPISPVRSTSKILPGTSAITIESSILRTVSTWQKQKTAFVQTISPGEATFRQRGLKSPKVRRILSSQLQETNFCPAATIASTPKQVQVCIDKIALADWCSSSTNRNRASSWCSLAEVSNELNSTPDETLSRSTSPEMLKFSTGHRSFKCRSIAVDELDNFQHIADGTMSKVFRATLHGKNVAVKTLRTSPTPLTKNNMSSQRRRLEAGKECHIGLELKCRQLQREIGLLSSFSHPNIVSFIACSISQDHIFLVTELLSLGSLENFLRNRQIRMYNTKDVFHFSNQIASACRHLHKLGIVHADIRVANILVTFGENISSETNASAIAAGEHQMEYTVKIADFGCATWKKAPRKRSNTGMSIGRSISKLRLWSKTRIHTDTKSRECVESDDGYERNRESKHVGTIINAAPELLAGLASNSMASDVYAFGMVLIQMMTRSHNPYLSNGVPVLEYQTLVVDHHRRPYLSQKRRRLMLGLNGRLASSSPLPLSFPKNKILTTSVPCNPGSAYLEMVRSCLEPLAKNRPTFDTICEALEHFLPGMLGNSKLISPSSPTEGSIPKRFKHRLNRVWLELICPRPVEKYASLELLTRLTLNGPMPQILKRSLKLRNEPRNAYERFISDLLNNLPYSCTTMSSTEQSQSSRRVDKWLLQSAFCSLNAQDQNLLMERWELELARLLHHRRHE